MTVDIYDRGLRILLTTDLYSQALDSLLAAVTARCTSAAGIIRCVDHGTMLEK